MNEVLRPRADILLVDDDADLREGLEYLLGAAGYTVRSAANGVEGLAIARELAPPFIVVLDLNMPILNGYDLLDQLRASEELRSLPTIVITARTDFSPANVAVLCKPFESAELLRLIAQHRPQSTPLPREEPPRPSNGETPEPP